MQVDHALDFRARGMHCAVNGEAGRVDGAARAVHHLASQVDLDQVGGADLVEAKTELIDQVDPGLTWHRG